MTAHPHPPGLSESDQYGARFVCRPVGQDDYFRTPMYCGQAACEWLAEEAGVPGYYDIEFSDQTGTDKGRHRVVVKLVPIANCVDITEEDTP